MKKKWVIISFVLFAVSVILALVTILSSKQKTEKVPEFVLLYADNQAENYPTTLGDVQFANLVYKKTDGRIKIDVKYGAELGSEADVINQMKYGGIAFARVSCTQLAERIPEMNVLNLDIELKDN